MENATEKATETVQEEKLNLQTVNKRLKETETELQKLKDFVLRRAGVDEL